MHKYNGRLPVPVSQLPGAGPSLSEAQRLRQQDAATTAPPAARAVAGPDSVRARREVVGWCAVKFDPEIGPGTKQAAPFQYARASEI